MYRGSVVKKLRLKPSHFQADVNTFLKLYTWFWMDFNGLPVINLTRCINTTLNSYFYTENKKNTPKLGLGGFYPTVVYILFALGWEGLHSLPGSLCAPLRQKQSRPFTVMSSESQKPPWTFKPPARVKRTPNSTITHSHSPQKRTLKRFCF